MSTLLEAALSYCDRGWFIVPCSGKKPYLDSWPSIRATREQITEWWTKWPEATIGLITGSASGVIRVDADGQEAVRRLYGILDGQPDTMEYATPSGGRGWLFEGSCEKIVLWKGKGEHEELRVQGDGEQCIIPPSPGWNWISDKHLAPLPLRIKSTVLSLRAAKAVAELEKQLNISVVIDDEQIQAALNCIPPDDRDVWIRIGMALHSVSDKYLEVWVDWSKGSNKFKDGECEGIWQNFTKGKISIGTLFHIAKEHGYRYRREPLTGIGNANILAKEIAGKIKYSDIKGWYSWTGKYWKQEGAELDVREAAKDSITQRYESAIRNLLAVRELGEDSEAKTKRLKSIGKVVSWLIMSQSVKHVMESITLAQSKPSVRVNYRDFDKHPYFLNCANGVLNLKTMELWPHNPEYMLSQISPTEYWPEALCPRWDRFLKEVFVEQELIDWMQKLLGYCISGDVGEHILPVWHGSGRNGKSTLVKVMINVLGPHYAATAPSGFTVLHKNEQHPAKLATLYGKRFVADLETGDGAKLDEALVKRLTGGDQMRARGMYENFWEFDQTHKLILATNYVPSVKGLDVAMQSRIRLVPFTQSFLGREEKGLDEVLANEASGILRWLVEGCHKWMQEGLGKTESVSIATNEYWSEQDSVKAFFEECIVQVKDNKILKGAVSEAYRIFCSNNCRTPVAPKTFGTSFTKLGVEREGTNYYKHINLKK